MKISKKERKKWFKEILSKKRIKEAASNFRDAFSEIVDIPNYVISDSSKITMVDNKQVLIEGYKNVVDYYLHYIKIRGNNIEIVIDGKDLDIKEITDDDLVITGKIFSVNFK